MFAEFPVVFLLLISSLILLWLENSLCLILTFKVLLRFVSWVMHDLSLVNILRLLKNKNSAVVGWSFILASTIISLQKCGWIAFKRLGLGLVPTLWCQLVCLRISENALLTCQDLTLELPDAWLGIWSVIRPHFPHMPIFALCLCCDVFHFLSWFSFKPCHTQVHLYLFRRSWPEMVCFIQWRSRRSYSGILSEGAVVPMTQNAVPTQQVPITPTDLQRHSYPNGNSHLPGYQILSSSHFKSLNYFLVNSLQNPMRCMLCYVKSLKLDFWTSQSLVTAKELRKGTGAACTRVSLLQDHVLPSASAL